MQDNGGVDIKLNAREMGEFVTVDWNEVVIFDWNEVVIFGLCTQYSIIIEFFHYYNLQETSTI